MTDNKHKKIELKVYIYWIVVVLYLAMIFYFSAQDGTKSHEVSAGLLHYIFRIASLLPEKIFNFLSGLFRNYEFPFKKSCPFYRIFYPFFNFYRAMIVSGVKVKKLIITLYFVFCMQCQMKYIRYLFPAELLL